MQKSLVESGFFIIGKCVVWLFLVEMEGVVKLKWSYEVLRRCDRLVVCILIKFWNEICRCVREVVLWSEVVLEVLVSMVIWYTNQSFSKIVIVPIKWYRGNHYKLAANDPKCQRGSKCPDLNHMLWQCPPVCKSTINLNSKVSRPLHINLMKCYLQIYINFLIRIFTYKAT